MARIIHYHCRQTHRQLSQLRLFAYLRHYFIIMSSETDERPPSTALYPFDDVSADVILRTSDNIDFFVYKLILSIASPFFKSMFSLPQSTQCTPPHPVIEVTESGAVIDALLRIVYPNTDQEAEDFEAVIMVLEAAKKYEVGKVENRMKPILRKFAEDNPLKVFAAACKLNLEDVTKDAALIWKKKPLSQPTFAFGMSVSQSFDQTAAGKSFTQDMKGISAASYYSLLRFIADPSNVCSQVFCSPPKTQRCNGAADEDEASVVEQVLELEEHLLSCNGDVILKSSDGAEVRMHKLLLEIASADYEGVLGAFGTSSDIDGPPVIQVREDGFTLAILCRLCYPFPDITSIGRDRTVSRAAAVCIAAENYKMMGVAELAKDILFEYMEHQAMEVFFYAKRHQWEDVAEEALQHCLALPAIDSAASYTPAMELISAEFYYDLLKTHFRSRKPVTTASPWSQPSLASSSLPTTIVPSDSTWSKKTRAGRSKRKHK